MRVCVCACVCVCVCVCVDGGACSREAQHGTLMKWEVRRWDMDGQMGGGGGVMGTGRVGCVCRHGCEGVVVWV